MTPHLPIVQLQLQYPTPRQFTCFIGALTHPRLFGDKSQILYYFIHRYSTKRSLKMTPFLKHSLLHLKTLIS